MKLYALNYQLCAAMQQMGNGPTDMGELAGFLDFPCANKVSLHMQQTESILGPIQDQLRDEAMKEAIDEEIQVTKEKEGENMKYHTSSEPGHEYGPTPALTCTYGK